MLFFLITAIASLPMIAAATAGRARPVDGHDMDHYADDLAAFTAHLDLKNAIHVGHSTGGGEVARYMRATARTACRKAVLVSAVPPLMVKTANPGGLPKRYSMDCRRSSRQPLAILSRASDRGLSMATTGQEQKRPRAS